MQAQFVEIYTAMRDNARPRREGERRRLGSPGMPPVPEYVIGEIHAYTPPSKAHRKRLERSGKGYVDATPKRAEVTPEQLARRRAMEIMDLAMSQVRITRTLASAYGKPSREEVSLIERHNSEYVKPGTVRRP